MMKLMRLPKCNPKRTVYFFLFITACVLFRTLVIENIQVFVDSLTSLLRSNKRKGPVEDGFKYVLLWKRYYLLMAINAYKSFSNLNCSVSNCIFTHNHKFLGRDTTSFHAIIYEGEIAHKIDIPTKRAPTQLYIFSTIESSYNLPACELYNENFFNWTFTYRLDSDVTWTYFVVRNLNGTIIAPSIHAKWETNVEPIRPEIKSILKGKKKTAAWLVSHCHTDSFRDEYLSRLQDHLFHYDLKIDVFGKCSKNNCPNEDCEEMIKKNYFFYMAFENSFAKDYVTEKVLHGYHNYAVPVVFGGANYSRFLPQGSFISARGIHPYNLAYTIYQAVKSPEIYESYFGWTNLYTIDSDAKVYNPLCNLCKALNSEKAKRAPPRDNFRLWWNGRNGMKWCLPDSYWNETARVNHDAKHILTLY